MGGVTVTDLNLESGNYLTVEAMSVSIKIASQYQETSVPVLDNVKKDAIYTFFVRTLLFPRKFSRIHFPSLYFEEQFFLFPTHFPSTYIPH